MGIYATLDIYILNFLKTLLLLSPYMILLGYFCFNRDDFFLKVRAETQYNIAIGLVAISFGLLMLWQVSEVLQELKFLNFDIDRKPIVHEIKDYKNTEILYIMTSSASNTVVLLLSTLAAILGWLCSTRSQVINNRRNHSMQVLIESRLSQQYMKSVNEVSTISISYKDSIDQSDKPEPIPVSLDFFKGLKVQEKNAVYYMLNYCEFVAVGIRFGDLDESLMCNTFRSMLITNYLTFKNIIDFKKQVSTTHFEHMTQLFERWNK